MHTPIQLHELLASRVFDAAGNPNPLAQAAETKQNKVTLDLTSGHGTVNITDDVHWSPKRSPIPAGRTGGHRVGPDLAQDGRRSRGASMDSMVALLSPHKDTAA